jgi:hypothetical protein
MIVMQLITYFQATYSGRTGVPNLTLEGPISTARIQELFTKNLKVSSIQFLSTQTIEEFFPSTLNMTKLSRSGIKPRSSRCQFHQHFIGSL